MSNIKCPFCAEEVLSDAIICKHCKSQIPPKPVVNKIKEKSNPFKMWFSLKSPLGILVWLTITMMFIGIISTTFLQSQQEQSQKQSIAKRQADIASKIKFTTEYINGKQPIKEMVIYSIINNKFINPIGPDNTYSEFDLANYENKEYADEYFVDSGVKADVYEEDTVNNKSLIKTTNRDNTKIVAWIESDALMTNKEYTNQKQKDDIESAKIGREDAEWDNSRAGRICNKHPEWGHSTCDRLANNEIWIGMSLDMLKSERGNPSSANPSNYGTGRSWQWCWSGYTPMCFYGADDGIINSYN